jgi:hypothetical protein
MLLQGLRTSIREIPALVMEVNSSVPGHMFLNVAVFAISDNEWHIVTYWIFLGDMAYAPRSVSIVT